MLFDQASSSYHTGTEVEKMELATMIREKRLFGRLSSMAVGISVLLFSVFMAPAEGIGKRTRGGPALKILEVASAPSPFEVGNGEMTFSVIVELPKRLDGANLLEVSALISSPSKRSMRFIAQRIPLRMDSQSQGNPRVHTTLLWNGRNQEKEFVQAGIYRYEIRAKLMNEQSDGPRTKIVSRRSRGTVEVTSLTVTEPQTQNELDYPQESSSDVEAPGEGDQISPEQAENLSVEESDPSRQDTMELEGVDGQTQEPNRGMNEDAPIEMQAPRES